MECLGHAQPEVRRWWLQKRLVSYGPRPAEAAEYFGYMAAAAAQDARKVQRSALRLDVRCLLIL